MCSEEEWRVFISDELSWREKEHGLTQERALLARQKVYKNLALTNLAVRYVSMTEGIVRVTSEDTSEGTRQGASEDISERASEEALVRVRVRVRVTILVSVRVRRVRVRVRVRWCEFHA